VQFLIQDLGIASHTTYPKFAIEHLYILRYNRSRVFSFLFLMQKLSGKTMVMLYKSCRVFSHGI
jgi:hypothetical protein